MWIQGKPGAGKSTLMKHALEMIERDQNQCVIFASFFFHGRGSAIQKIALGLFRSLIHQIAQQILELLSDLTSSSKKKYEVQGPFGEKWDWHEGELRRIFNIHFTDAARTYRIQLYIDALDKCGEEVTIDLCLAYTFLVDTTHSSP